MILTNLTVVVTGKVVVEVVDSVVGSSGPQSLQQDLLYCASVLHTCLGTLRHAGCLSPNLQKEIFYTLFFISCNQKAANIKSCKYYIMQAIYIFDRENLYKIFVSVC